MTPEVPPQGMDAAVPPGGMPPGLGMPPGMPPGMPGMPPGMPMGMPAPPPPLQPPLGVGPWTHLWNTLIHSEDISSIASEFDYRVEAASSRKPNRDKMVADLNDFGQQVLPVLQPLIVGNPENIRILDYFMSKFSEARDMEPPPKLLPPLPPPMPMPGPQGPPQGPPQG